MRNNREYIRPETPCQALFEKKLKIFFFHFMEIFRAGNCSVTAPQIHKKKFFSLPKSCICLPPVILYKSVKSPFSGLTIFRKFKKTYREGEKNMPYCPNCGQQIDGTMRFCPGCGAALGGVNSTTSANTAYRHYKICNKKRSQSLRFRIRVRHFVKRQNTGNSID